MVVMIGIDPHKRSHTAVALNGSDEVLGRLRVTADRRQIDRLIAFAAAWPDRVWAIRYRLNRGGTGGLLRSAKSSGPARSESSPELSNGGRKHTHAPVERQRCPRTCETSASTMEPETP